MPHWQVLLISFEAFLLLGEKSVSHEILFPIVTECHEHNDDEQS